MDGLTLRERVRLAEKLHDLKPSTAESVTQQFLERHPDWFARYGARARKSGVEDAEFHIGFLVGAVESGSVLAFQEYARWATRVLAVRGIAPEFLRENFEQLQAGLAAHLTPPELQLVTRMLEAGRSATTEPAAANLPGPEAALTTTNSAYIAAALRGDRKAAGSVVEDALRSGFGLFDIYLGVFQQSLYEVGRLWETAQISVAQEHMATAVTYSLMVQLYSRQTQTAKALGRAVITGVQGERHEVGAHMVADALEMNGWNVRSIGTDAPHSGILAAIEEHQPQVIGITATMLFNLTQVRKLIEDLRRRSSNARILLGGTAFRFAPSLWEEIGADGFAPDLRSALAMVSAWQEPNYQH